VNGKEVFSADFEPAIAANPYIQFKFRATESGPMVLTWTDDDGSKIVGEKKSLSIDGQGRKPLTDHDICQKMRATDCRSIAPHRRSRVEGLRTVGDLHVCLAVRHAWCRVPKSLLGRAAVVVVETLHVWHPDVANRFFCQLEVLIDDIVEEKDKGNDRVEIVVA
jgi:hypothetical protein